MQRCNSGVFCNATDDVVNCRLVEPAHGGQFIAGDSPALTQRCNALDQDFRICHDPSVFHKIYPKTGYFMHMITSKTNTYTQIRVIRASCPNIITTTHRRLYVQFCVCGPANAGQNAFSDKVKIWNCQQLLKEYICVWRKRNDGHEVKNQADRNN